MENFKKCKVENCDGNAHYKAGGRKGNCNKHRIQIQRYKKILARTIYDKNEIIDCGEYYEICLYNIKCEEVGRAKIDKEDLDKVRDYKWGLNNKGYVITQTKNLFLHHLIFGRKKGYEVDHRNTNPLNNRKSNLRFATHSQNGMNSKSKGYCWDRRENKWIIQICKDQKNIYIGSSHDEKIAQKMAEEARQKYFGEYAYKETNNIINK